MWNFLKQLWRTHTGILWSTSIVLNFTLLHITLMCSCSLASCITLCFPKKIGQWPTAFAWIAFSERSSGVSSLWLLAGRLWCTTDGHAWFQSPPFAFTRQRQRQQQHLLWWKFWSRAEIAAAVCWPQSHDTPVPPARIERQLCPGSPRWSSGNASWTAQNQ